MKFGVLSGPKPLSMVDAAGLVEFAHQAGRSFVGKLSRVEQKAAGQFMTPPAIAGFMAQRLIAPVDRPHVRLLEPSAGAGILIAAVAEALLKKPALPRTIDALIFEKDMRLMPLLEALCLRISEACSARGANFNYKLFCEDFLLSEVALLGQPIEGLLTIANPPFFKLNKALDERAGLHSYAVFGQPNIYGLFMAATARLTPPDGRWCFIAPRSWMNGHYFKAVRHTMLRHLTMESLHVFESRRDSFEEDAVLQETVIAWANGRAVREVGLDVLLTRSQGIADMDHAPVRAVPTELIVANDEHATVTVPGEGASLIDGWTSTLSTYGLKVSTGPVVAFRCREFLSHVPKRETVPLLWMQHIGQQHIMWPIAKKLEHIDAIGLNAWTLVPNAPMVIMRRFSPKEDLRRVICAPYFGELPGAAIGLENHLNYIHRPGGRMSRSEVRGLSAFLASSAVDLYLRTVAGSTQINARELRALPLPPMSAIETVGERLSLVPTLDEIDTSVEAVLGSHRASQKVVA